MENFSTSSKPLQVPQDSAVHVVVLGAGVIGLTTAWGLLDRGYKVTILANNYASESDQETKPSLSSEAAGALWKCLPLECGPQAVTANLETNQKWTLESYKVYSALQADPSLSGVVENRPCTILTTGPIEGNSVLSKKLDFVKSNIPGYRHGADLFEEYGFNTAHCGGLSEAYEYTAPVINVDLAINFLTHLVESKGAVLKTRKIQGDLLVQEASLLGEYGADIIVNAMGLGAREAAADESVYALHGALLRFVNDGSDFPIIENATIVSSTKVGESGGDGVFVLPRADGVLALGTISTAEGEATDLTVDSDAVREMRGRCEDLLPQLRNARLVADRPLIQGTRPQRRGGPRVERENRRERSRIVHAYGHGGAGWSLSIGSAQETARIVGQVAAEVVDARAALASVGVRTAVQKETTSIPAAQFAEAIAT